MSDDVRNMYIDGKWVLAEGGATFDVVNPADQSVAPPWPMERRQRS